MEEDSRYWWLGEITAEDPEKYCEGGYCPVHISDMILERFKIVHKLGHGGFATVWLAREEDKSRYVALKIVAAEHSKTYEDLPGIASLQKDNPSLFLTEHERFFVDSRNGRHLCQVFPVLGPTLHDLTDFNKRIYPEYMQNFARQMARAVEVMHSSGLCHGDLTARNIALRLSKSLDRLSEEEIWEMFPPQDEAIRPRSDKTNSESMAPEYEIQGMDLTQLSAEYLSSELCILDFDQTYSSRNPPPHLLGISPGYLAPESIFDLSNGPPADVWALGCLIFRMRCGPNIFVAHPDTPSNAIASMYGILGGHLLEHWKTVPFDTCGWPVHDRLKDGVHDHTFSGDYNFSYPSLLDFVRRTFDVNLLKSVDDKPGTLKFCANIPRDAFDRFSHVKPDWAAKNTTPISPKEEKSFYELMLRVFEYDPSKRITASLMLSHPWFTDT